MVISAVAGMAGVGKTALAVHWARRVAHRFPDGQLYVNLRGYDAEGAAVTPEEVTGWFLAALGVPAFQIPADAQTRCGLYRSVLAGQRVLIVLDNARDAAQVRPLLPGSAGCLVVVTSRSALAGLAAAEGARPLRLGPLAAEEGVQLLAARLGPERVAAEPAAVTELTARCGHLPLALAVMAARAAADPGLPLGVLAGQLALAADAEAAAAGGAAGAGAGRLEALETGDPATSLGQLLSWSYRQLSPPAAAMSVLLGVHCGPDITVPAAASLAGVSRAEAGRALAELAGASLAAEHRPGRYVLHNLVRGYAAGQARQILAQAGIRAAVERSLDHYLHTIAHNSLSVVALSSGVQFPFAIAPPAPGVLPEQLTAVAELQDWARAEHQVMLQAIAQAAAAGFITHAWQIFHNHAWMVGGAGYWADIRATGQPVLDAAEAAGDQVALGWTHAIIGRYGAFLGTGAQDLARALGHFRQAGDLSGQAWAQLFASMAYGVMGNWAEGVTQSEQALALFRQTGEPGGQGWALAGLGEWHARLGNYAGPRLRPAGPGGRSRHRRPHLAGHRAGSAGPGALRARRATPGDQLLPAGPGLYPRADAPDGPRAAAQPAGGTRRRLPGRRGSAGRHPGVAAGASGPRRPGMAGPPGNSRQARAGQPAGLIRHAPPAASRNTRRGPLCTAWRACDRPRYRQHTGTTPGAGMVRSARRHPGTSRRPVLTPGHPPQPSGPGPER